METRIPPTAAIMNGKIEHMRFDLSYNAFMFMNRIVFVLNKGLFALTLLYFICTRFLLSNELHLISFGISQFLPSPCELSSIFYYCLLCSL